MTSQQEVVVVSKVTKVRRTRQPKNPQLSVARRNERERNRVKMVNNGFALLREHLPVEDLKPGCAAYDDEAQMSGEESPDLLGKGINNNNNNSSASSTTNKTKKYSKVETLRAAVRYIKFLEDLKRESDPAFESINLLPSGTPSSSKQLLSQFTDDFDEPGSSASYCGDDISVSSTVQQQQQQHRQQQVASYATNQQGQFIKLEPSPLSQQLPSPQNSQTSHATTSYSPPANNQTQVHFVNHQQQQQLYQPSHTHLWIQQHQSSFIEQQQLTTSNQWAYQQQPHHHHHHHMQQQQQQPQYVESPEMQQQQTQQQQQHSQLDTQTGWFQSQQAAFAPSQQISLYSQ